MKDGTGRLCCLGLDNDGCESEMDARACEESEQVRAIGGARMGSAVAAWWANFSHNKGLFFLGSLGALLMGIASAIYIFNPLEIIAKSQLSLKDGSFAYEAWKKPPVKVGVKVFVYNYTNAEAFMRGEEKLKVEEIGPYLFTEVLENTNVTFHKNHSVTYTPRRSVIQNPACVQGDPKKQWIIVPNIVYLGVLSYLAEQSLIVNMGFNTFTTFLDSQPFINMTVHEFLWDYDDPLIEYGHKIAPETIPFKRFGYVDRMFDDGINTVRMNLNDHVETRADGRDVRPLSIDTYNGSPGLKHWGYDVRDNKTQHMCNLLQGYASEGVLFPRKMSRNDSFVIYRKAFCRTLEIVFDYEDKDDAGISAYHYKLREDAFDSSIEENSCFCKRKRGPCLPKGLSDISPCYWNIPVAVSLPHFLNGDPKLVNDIEGLNPNVEAHGSIAVIQPDIGLLMRAHSRIQTNLVMGNTKYNANSAPFNNIVIPIFWVDFYFEELPDNLTRILNFLVVTAPILQKALILAFGTAGLIMAAISLLNTASLIRVSTKTHRKASVLWRGDYQTVQIIPVIRRESLGAA